MKLSHRLQKLESVRPKDPTGGITVFMWEPQDEAALQQAECEAAAKNHRLIVVSFVDPPVYPPDPPL